LTQPAYGYILPLHDALPISDHAGAMTSAVVLTGRQPGPEPDPAPQAPGSGETRGSARIDGQTPVPQRGSEAAPPTDRGSAGPLRSEEHTSELQSRENLVCRL